MDKLLPVLIIGAGPTGLMMGCELARFGIPFRIIDKKSGPTMTTNAAGIQARTLEIFEHIGIVDKFIKDGVKATHLNIHKKSKLLAHMHIDALDSHFKYILLYPQSGTEKLLNLHLESLAQHVEWNTELVELNQTDDRVIAKIIKPDGREETIESQWLIGCDGYRSTVRSQAGIAMQGSDLEQEFAVADGHVKTKLANNGVDVFIDQGEIFALFPLGGHKYRFVANLKTMTHSEFTSDQLKELVKKRTGGECELTDIIWSSPFWIHSKIANKLRERRIFIAGDAAHVHSPAGAQGMNTGLQDAFNLVWKLALVIEGRADAKILDSYQAERLAIIKPIVAITEKMAHIGLSENPLVNLVFKYFITYIPGKSRKLQQKMAARLSQLSLNYKQSPIIEYNTSGHALTQKPGYRIADVIIADNVRFYDFLRNNLHNLFLFTGSIVDEQVINNVKTISQWVRDHYNNLINCYVVSKKEIDVTNLIIDENYRIKDKFNIIKPSMCLVRPDQVIALFVNELDLEMLKHYLRTLFDTK